MAVKEEFRKVFQPMSTSLLLMVGIPVIYSLLFGQVYSQGVVKNIPTVVYDQDQSAASRSVIRAFADSERFQLVEQVASQEEMETSLQENRALAAVAIPPNFQKNIKLGLSSEVSVLTNATNLMYANTVLSTIQELTQTLTAGTGQQLVEAMGQPPSQALRTAAPVRISVRITHNPTLSYNNFILPGLGANGLQIGIFLAVCTTITGLYAKVAALRGRSSVAVIAGRLLPYWLGGVLGFIGYMLVIVFIFGVPCKGSIGQMLLLGGTFSLALVAISALYSAVAPSEIMALQLPMLYFMPAFLFSGYSWPFLAMNEFSRWVSAILPLTYLGGSLRNLMLNGYAPSFMSDVLVLLLFSAVGFAAAVLIFVIRRRKLDGQVAGQGVSV
jgi:ABC-2 type transport system permease protein